MIRVFIRAIRAVGVAGALLAAMALLPVSPAHATSVGDTKIVRIDPARMLDGEALEAIGDGFDDGTGDHVYGRAWRNVSRQKWKMTIVNMYVGAWDVKFQNLAYSGKCMDRNMWGNPYVVRLNTCYDTLSQLWRIKKTGSVPGADVFEITNYMDGYWLSETVEEQASMYSVVSFDYRQFALYTVG